MIRGKQRGPRGDEIGLLQAIYIQPKEQIAGIRFYIGDGHEAGSQVYRRTGRE